MTNKRIYADNAATTRLSRKALEAMLPYLTEEYGNTSQPYSFARPPKKALKEARTTIANCIGAQPEEIFFTSCGTESDNWVIQGAIRQNLDIITSSIEHHAILRPCQYAENKGRKVTYLPVNNDGTVSPLSLNNAIEKNNGIVSIMFANNEIGTIEPIKELASLTHNRGYIFHTDAVQALGHIHIDVHELGIDLLSASAHKFNGPKGIGFLYIKKGLFWPSLIMGGNQENFHRAGTENVASIIGMAVALQENVSQIDANAIHLQTIENIIIEELNKSKIPFLRNGAKKHIFGNMSLSFPNFNGESLLHRLDLLGISVSTGSACDSKNTQISHVLSAIGLEKSYALGTIRISLSKTNTEEDAKKIATALSSILLP